MRNSQGSGHIVDLTAPVGGITSGDIAVIGALVVVASHDAVEGQKFVGESQGLFLLPKVPTEAWAEGDAIYWDAVGKQATTAPGAISLGLAAAVASNPSTRGSVLLPARASSGGTPGGNPNEFQYNNAGAFGGAPELTRQATTPPQLVLSAGTVDPAEAAAFQNANDGFGGVLLADDTQSQGLLLYSIANAGNLTLGSLRGTFAAPTKVLTSNGLGNIAFEGYTGTFMGAPASITAAASTDGDAAPFKAQLLVKVRGTTDMGIQLEGGTDTLSIGTSMGALAELQITPHAITLPDFAGGGTRPLTASNTGVLGAVTGASGSFTTVDGKTVTVTNGLITAIV